MAQCSQDCVGEFPALEHLERMVSLFSFFSDKEPHISILVFLASLWLGMKTR